MKTTAVDRSVDNGLTQMFNLVNEILCSQTSEILTKQARTIKVSKVTKRHCAGTVQSQGGRVGNVKQVGFEPGSKTCRRGADVTRSGRLFQTRAAATGKARSPTVVSRVRLTISDKDELERSRRRASTSAT